MRQAIESTEAAAAPTGILTGTIIGGRFRIESLLGREGGTVIYRAADTGAGTPWTLRIIPLATIAGDADDLLAEVKKTQALHHKNLVDVEAVGREGELLFVASEFIDGQTLREFIDGKRAEGRGVSLKGATNLVAHVANALDYARRMSVHGALTPAVIWVNRAGRVKVSALGLAAGVPSMARHGAPSGAPETVYVAPEVLAGARPTTMSDTYSLGAILYELLTGHPPGSPLKPASAVVNDLPGAVDAVIERALSRDPDERWPSATALKDALQGAAGVVDSGRPTGATSARPAFPSAPGMTAPVGAMSPLGSPEAARSAPRGASQTQAGPTSAGARAPESGKGPAMVPAQVADDEVERWLIHKEGLDFGPFSMVQLRVQIERGEVLGDHILMDNESGARCRVKEYPGLGDLVKRAHRHIEQARRAQAEQRSAKSEKKKSFATTLIVGFVLIAVLGGVAFYVISRRDSTGGRLASREEEAEIESFLKGVKISGLKASVRRGGHRSAGSPSGGSAEDFNNDANFGDASKGFTEGDQTLDDDQIQNTMMANYRKLIPCIVHGGVNEIAMEFVVRGNGKVGAVKVNGQRTGALPACLLGRMQSFNFPKFNGSKTIASWSMSMGR